MPLGMIDHASIRWQQLPRILGGDTFEFSFDNRKIHLTESDFKNAVVTGKQQVKLLFFLHFNKQKHLLGIQFVPKVSWGYEHSLTLKIYGHSISNFVLGTLGTTELSHISNVTSNGQNIDQELKIPGRSGWSRATVTKNKTLRFGLSNEEADAGQSFVPFFDGSDVSTENRIPLAGIGLLHFTDNRDYAGYVKPYLITLNLNAFM